MKKASEFVDNLREVFRLFGSVQARSMFGGHGIYHDGVMIGLVADDTLYLKFDAVSAPRFIEAGSRAFEYTKNGVTMKMSYSSAPVEIFDDPDTAKVWATLAYDAALRARGKSAGRRHQSKTPRGRTAI